MVVELKVASALLQRIWFGMRSLANIIIKDCLKKLKHSCQDITSLRAPYPKLWQLDGNPSGCDLITTMVWG